MNTLDWWAVSLTHNKAVPDKEVYVYINKRLGWFSLLQLKKIGHCKTACHLARLIDVVLQRWCIFEFLCSDSSSLPFPCYWLGSHDLQSQSLHVCLNMGRKFYYPSECALCFLWKILLWQPCLKFAVAGAVCIHLCQCNFHCPRQPFFIHFSSVNVT